MHRFREHFGASPETHTAIFADLQTTNHIAAARIAKPSLKYLLMATYWLKTYSTESEMAGTFKVDEKMARKHVCSCDPSSQGTEGTCQLQHALLLWLHLLYSF